MTRLAKSERCPLHSSYKCCGRGVETDKPRRQASGPVRRIDDPHHPRGYRELRSPAEMRRLVVKKVAEQKGKCAICGKAFHDIREAVPDHIEPRGMGGAWRDDHPSNIQACCVECNNAKGSIRNFKGAE